MTQKQYEDMASIMQFSRLFADAMRKAMENCGLSKDYYLEINVHNVEYEHRNATELTNSVCLASEEDGRYNGNSMCQMRIGEERWMVVNDPVVRAGNLPPEVHCRKKESGVQGTDEARTKPYPPDGFWISSHDYPAYVGGGQ